jgi:sterol desaturase/sphingolipid hydroxylase (fatty acid hydroxylase superfamily)
MKRKSLYNLAHICTLVLVPGVAAWVLGQPLIFPSLGPSAFALVLDDNENRVRRVVGGHLIGVVSGLLAYHLLAHGLTLAALSPALSVDGLHIVASGVVSIVLTVAAMSVARANHAPACATTLIVSLGVLPGLVDGALIMVAVTGMFLTHRLVMLARK